MLWGSAVDHVAVAEYEDGVACSAHVLHQVRTEHDGGSGAGEGTNEVTEVEALGGVEADGGLVEEKQGGGPDDGTGDAGATEHATGKGLHPVTPPVGQPDGSQRLVGRRPGLLGRNLAQPGAALVNYLCESV